MSDEDQNRLTIDIVSDVVCPWCIIGYKQLKKALDVADTQADIKWHPFELNPNMPPEGQNLREHISEKYGTSPAESARSRAHMTQLGVELGFEFNFDDSMRMYNTFLAHQLLHWADQQDMQHQLKLELFRAHFTANRNLADINILADCAAIVGLPKNDALAVLNDQRFAHSVREEQQVWLRRGIQGVPATVFNRRHLVSGAQGEEGFAKVLSALQAESTA